MANPGLDMSQVRDLAADLSRAADDGAYQVRAVIKKAGVNMKAQLRQEAQSPSMRFRRVQYAITFDEFQPEDGGFGVEVGPEVGHEKGHTRAQGGLAFMAYYGTPDGDGPSFPDPMGALDKETAVVADYLGKIAGRIL